MKYIISESELNKLVEDALKYRAFMNWGINHDWGGYWDALSEYFPEITDDVDYEDFSKMAKNYISTNTMIKEVI